jgi:hypothetical protein
MRGWLAKSLCRWDLQRRVARPAHFLRLIAVQKLYRGKELGSVTVCACDHLSTILRAERFLSQDIFGISGNCVPVFERFQSRDGTF